MDGAPQIAQMVAIAAPLVVAALCMYSRHRGIGSDYLTLWGAAHVGLGIVFLLTTITSDTVDLSEPPTSLVATYTIYAWVGMTLLMAVVSLIDPRIRLHHGLVVGGTVATAVLTAQILFDSVAVSLITPLLATATFGATALLLLLRYRSAAYLFAGVVLLARAGNSAAYSVTVWGSGVPTVTIDTYVLSVFLNFLTGVSLLMIAVDDTWQRLQTALCESRRAHALSEAVLELAPVSILLKDRDLKIVNANRYAVELARRLRPRDPRLIGERLIDVSPGSSAERGKAIDQALLADPKTGPWEYEGVYGLGDDDAVEMLVRKSALVGGNGAVDGTITVSLDITEIKRKERKLQELFEHAERANQEKTDFLANMSHELRTPLNGISGFAEMLAAGYLGALNAHQKDYVDNILTASRNMLGLVSDMLDLSRLESGRLTIDRNPVELAGVIEAIVAAAEPMARERGIAIHTEVASQVIDADRRALLQVLSNLIDNAVVFNRSGGEVRITAMTGDGRTTITIADTGVGMTPGQIAASRDPFLRGDPLKARHGGGAGLGLVVARGLVELHGGTLTIRSEPGEGTTITVAL